MSSKPFLPSDLPKTDPLLEWRRMLLVKALANGRNPIDEVALRLWPDQPALRERLVQRAMTSPASINGWGGIVAGGAVGAFMRSLRPLSAAAQLFDAANAVTMEGVATVAIPAPATSFPVPVFVGEGAPIPAMQGSIAQSVVGPPKKLASIVALTGELVNQSADTADTILRMALEEAASRALDAAVFSNAPASETRPAGLLNGVTPISGTAGGGVTALATDAKNLVGGIVDAGGGVDVAFFMNPRQAVVLSILAPGFAYPIIPAPVLPTGTVVAIERRAIVSGFPALPDVNISRDSTVVFENTNPPQFSTGGAVGGRIQSAFQSDLLTMRLIQRCAWTSMIPGAVQMVTGSTW